MVWLHEQFVERYAGRRIEGIATWKHIDLVLIEKTKGASVDGKEAVKDEAKGDDKSEAESDDDFGSEEEDDDEDEVSADVEDEDTLENKLG